MRNGWDSSEGKCAQVLHGLLPGLWNVDFLVKFCVFRRLPTRKSQLSIYYLRSASSADIFSIYWLLATGYTFILNVSQYSWL